MERKKVAGAFQFAVMGAGCVSSVPRSSFAVYYEAVLEMVYAFKYFQCFGM